MLFIRAARPTRLDAAVRLVEKILYIGTATRVHRDTLAARHVANDLFAANWITTTRAVHKQIVLSFDLERIRALPKKRA